MKERKTTRTKLTLYRKEQLLILTILLCFVLSACIVPKFRDSTTTEEVAENVLEEEITDTPSSEDTIAVDDAAEADDTSDADDAADTAKTEEDQQEVQEVEETVSPDEPSDKPSQPAQKPSQSSKPSKADKKEDTVKKPAKEKEEKKETKKEEPAAPAKKDEPKKEWVPPVYKTVHHDAVYETQRIAVCNYCSETFATVGEFQIHKDANGG